VEYTPAQYRPGAQVEVLAEVQPPVVTHWTMRVSVASLAGQYEPLFMVPLHSGGGAEGQSHLAPGNEPWQVMGEPQVTGASAPGQPLPSATQRTARPWLSQKVPGVNTPPT
jgi:hypothetical protein